MDSGYVLCGILCTLGLFFIIMSYGAQRAGRSGVPFTGALFIAIGFLVTPYKWLALLALADPGFFMIGFMIKDNIDYKKAVPVFEKAFAEGGYKESNDDELITLDISVPVINETLTRKLKARHIMLYHIPRVFFSIVYDKSGSRKLLVLDKGGQVRALPFDEDTLTIEGLEYKGKPADIILTKTKE